MAQPPSSRGGEYSLRFDFLCKAGSDDGFRLERHRVIRGAAKHVHVFQEMDWYVGGVWLTRLFIQRAMAVIYLIAFIVVLNQFRPLLGERGLLPVPAFLKRTTFWQAPTVFHWRYSDRLVN